jgi:hypothetical protein
MRLIQQFPLMAGPIAIFNALGFAGQWLDAESLYYDAILPSGAEFYLKLGELIMVLGLLALGLDILRSGRITLLGAGLAVAIFLVALAEFQFVAFCGTTTFFFLMLMALTEALAFVVLCIVRRA